MELVTHKDESDRLQREMPVPAPVFDVVLDDGSLVQSVVVVNDRAIGVIVGGHTGFLPFAAVPELATRRVRDALRLTRCHRFPFIGSRIRHRWAQTRSASVARPSWMPLI